MAGTGLALRPCSFKGRAVNLSSTMRNVSIDVRAGEPNSLSWHGFSILKLARTNRRAILCGKC